MKSDFGLLVNNSSKASFQSLLGVKDDEVSVKISINDLREIENQPFMAYSNEALKELADDIKLNGLYSPLIVRKKSDYYEILSGRNRFRACKLNGDTAINCIVKNVDDDTANLILVNANLNQRQELKPSEKALAYDMQFVSMKNLGIVRGKGTAEVTMLGEIGGDSRGNVYKYLRLAKLIRPLLLKVDDNTLQIAAGVQLSYIDTESQEQLTKYIIQNKCKINEKKAILIRKAFENDGKLTYSLIDEILHKNNVKTKDISTQENCRKQDISELIKTMKRVLPYEDSIDGKARFVKEIVSPLLPLLSNVCKGAKYKTKESDELVVFLNSEKETISEIDVTGYSIIGLLRDVLDVIF